MVATEPDYVLAHGEFARLALDLGFSLKVSGGKSITQDQSGWNHRRWTCTLTREGYAGSMRVTYRTGTGILATPDLVDVLSSVISDASYADQSFAYFAGEMGLDADSMTAHRTFLACKSAARRFAAFEISPAAMERLQDPGRPAMTIESETQRIFAEMTASVARSFSELEHLHPEARGLLDSRLRWLGVELEYIETTLTATREATP